MCCIPRTAVFVLLLALVPATHAVGGTPGVSGEHDFNMYCASCHGETGQGDGPKAFSLAAKPPDLQTLTKRYGRFPQDMLARMIDGREPIPGHGEREMPVWGVWFKEEAAAELGGAEGDDATVARRVTNLIGYIESLQVK